jgi:hypothetical protein
MVTLVLRGFNKDWEVEDGERINQAGIFVWNYEDVRSGRWMEIKFPQK